MYQYVQRLLISIINLVEGSCTIYCNELQPGLIHWPQATRSPVTRHFRGSITVASCADGRPAKLRLGVVNLVKSCPAVAMFGTLFPCPCTRLGIHLETDGEISKDSKALYTDVSLV